MGRFAQLFRRVRYLHDIDVLIFFFDSSVLSGIHWSSS